MSEQVQQVLSQLLKTQLEKKSSKKTEDQVVVIGVTKKNDKPKEDLAKQKEKMRRNQEREEFGAKVSQEERWAMYRRLIIENAARIFMILLYFAVSCIAICKAGIIILTAFQHFLQDMFVTVPPSSPITSKH